MTLRYSADFHFNVFGPQPRMLCGVVARDRPSNGTLPPWLLRPVVATFTAEGVGEDTADFDYDGRGFSAG